MHLEIRRQITIEAPADDVWRVLAHEYARIDRWVSLITESEPAADVPALDGAPVGGRVCANSVPGFDVVQEEFIYYDEEGRRFGYAATKGLPSFFTKAENNWSVRSLGPDRCLVESQGDMELKNFPGLILAPILKFQMGRIASQVGEELKHYVELGQPHPRKAKAGPEQPRKAPAAT